MEVMQRLTFETQRHMSDSFKILEYMQKGRVLCDVTLVAKDVEIAAHKNVLAACSPYFYSMFTNLQPAEQQRVQLDVNPEILLSIVNYMYTSKLTVIEQNVIELLDIAKMLLLSAVQLECCSILERMLRPNNCFNIKRVAVSCGDFKLLNSVSSYIDDNFVDTTDSEEFLNLTCNEITELISKDTLKVSSEEKVYECIVKWINNDPKERRKYLRLLMGHVRLRFISKNYLRKHLVEGPFLKGDPYCINRILKALFEEDETIVEKTKPRQYNTKVLLVIGGCLAKNDKSLEYYDFRKKCWSNTLDMPFSIWNARLAVVNQKIYVIGGRGYHGITSEVKCYNINTNNWDEINGMTVEREKHGVGVLDNCIYAVGGLNNGLELNSAEKYDFYTQKWSFIPPMLKKRRDLGVGVLNDILYAVGGKDRDFITLKSVECYNYRTNTWKELSSMNSPRSVAGVCTLDGKLYAIGGHNQEKFLSCAEVYSPDTDTWTMIAPMQIARGYHDVAVMDNKIYVTGGMDDNNDINLTEVYDKVTNSWTFLPKAMNMARMSHMAVIITKHS